MPGPVRYDKKGRVKKTKPRSFGSASKPQPKSPAPVTAAASAVAKATKRAVSRADIPKAARKARKSALASKEAQESIERLRQKFSTNLDINQRTAKRERKLENTALKSLYDTRGEALKAEKNVRAATRLNAEGSRVESLDGLKQVGVQPLGQVQRAADAGQIRREGKTFTTPQVRRTRRQVKRAKRELRRAKAATMTPKKNLMKAGLDAEQAQVLSTVLKVGKKRGATKKEMLAAVETALVESNIRNLGYGDADSSGWRQERAMYYPTGKMGPQNVKASANRFFDESISDANRGAGMTAGQLAQAIQASAYPDRYDERKGEAVPLLKAFNSAGNASPEAKARLKQARARAKAVTGKAAEIGLPGVTGGKDRYKGPNGSGLVYPLAIKGEFGGGPEAHAARAFDNWMSDNAVDLNVPVGTPVRAVTDAVVTRTSGSPPNHAANPAGWTVYLKDANGEEYSYMHLENFSVKPGQKVKAGQTIGKSGAANGVAHLHFATKNSNPEDVIAGKEVKPQFVNFSKKGGAGTSTSKWLAPTGGNEYLKFQRPFAEALIGLARASGEPIQINSAYRSYAEQQELFEAWKNGTGNLAAPPGSSNHEFGSAADVNLTARQRELAPQFDLHFPVAGEDWHIELKDPAGQGIVTPNGSPAPSSSVPYGGGGAAPSGGTATARGGRRKNQQVDVLKLLRQLGYSVTRSGVKRVGGELSTFSEAPESITDLKKRYKVE